MPIILKDQQCILFMILCKYVWWSLCPIWYLKVILYEKSSDIIWAFEIIMLKSVTIFLSDTHWSK